MANGWRPGWFMYCSGCCASRGAFVCPIRYGSGTRLKLFEAFAAGLPVVSTRLGAEGIDCVEGEHLLLADTPEDQAAAILRVLGDEELARGMGRAARALALERYDWREIGRGRVEIYEELIAITSRSAPET